MEKQSQYHVKPCLRVPEHVQKFYNNFEKTVNDATPSMPRPPSSKPVVRLTNKYQPQNCHLERSEIRVVKPVQLPLHPQEFQIVQQPRRLPQETVQQVEQPQRQIQIVQQVEQPQRQFQIVQQPQLPQETVQQVEQPLRQIQKVEQPQRQIQIVQQVEQPQRQIQIVQPIQRSQRPQEIQIVQQVEQTPAEVQYVYVTPQIIQLPTQNMQHSISYVQIANAESVQEDHTYFSNVQ